MPPIDTPTLKTWAERFEIVGRPPVGPGAGQLAGTAFTEGQAALDPFNPDKWVYQVKNPVSLDQAISEGWDIPAIMADFNRQLEEDNARLSDALAAMTAERDALAAQIAA